MNSFSITTPGEPLPIKIQLTQGERSSENRKLAVFINGDGKQSDFEAVVKVLEKIRIDCDYLTFDFRGVQEEVPRAFTDFVHDWFDLEKYLGDQFQYTSVALVSTSSGAYVAVHALQNPRLPINKAIFLDPADYYYPNGEQSINVDSWVGSAMYIPTQKTVSDLMRSITTSVFVDVVGFQLRNTRDHAYIEPAKRHLDNEGYFPRLNQEMVHAFYEKTPLANRGKFMENRTLPHAYVRDGNVEKNILEVATILNSLL